MAGDPALLGQGLPVKCSGFFLPKPTGEKKNASHNQTKTWLTPRNCVHPAVRWQHGYVTDESVAIAAILAKTAAVAAKADIVTTQPRCDV